MNREKTGNPGIAAAGQGDVVPQNSLNLLSFYAMIKRL